MNEQIVAFQAEIREIAGKQMSRERMDHTLQATALVSEAYLKLRTQGNLDGASRAVFLAAAAQTIRRVLIDHARERHAMIRGGNRERFTLSDADPSAKEMPADFIDLNDAIDRLQQKSSRMYDVVVCRYFAGMTMSEIAEAQGVSLRTVEGDWTFAKAWLRRELEG